MAHIDKYGRSWKFTPGHDADQMLKPDPKKFNAVFALQGVLNDTLAQGFDTENDSYLLKGGPDGWYVGIRYGNEPYEYVSPYLSKELIQLLVHSHCTGAYTNAQESEAIWQLYSKPKTNLKPERLHK